MLLALTFIIGAFMIFFNFIIPTYENIKVIRSEQVGREQAIDGYRAAISKVRKLIDEYQGETDLQESISASFPLSPNLSSAIAQLGGLADQNKISILSLSISESDGGGRGAQKITPFSKPVNVLSFNLRLEGSYQNLKQFTKNLETNIRIFDVKDISIQPAISSSRDLYNVNLRVDTYYQEG